MVEQPKVYRPIVMLKRPKEKRALELAKEKVEQQDGLKRIIKQYPLMKEIRIPSTLADFSFAQDQDAKGKRQQADSPKKQPATESNNR